MSISKILNKIKSNKVGSNPQLQRYFKWNNKQLNLNFLRIPIDYSWSFNEKTIKDTSYITHSYYTYPAKFIPQLVERLLKEFSQENDIIIDPFMGSGTAIVESIVNNRIGIGVDINDIAFLVAKVKTTPIDSELLSIGVENLIYDLNNKFNNDFQNSLENAIKYIPNNDKIDYWFLPKQKEKLTIIFATILELKNNNIKDFCLVAFAQILKSTSIWLQKSIKPTRDNKKTIYEPFKLFSIQLRKMVKKHIEFNTIISKEVRNNIDKYRIIKHCDSRQIPCESNKADIIITSPPYTTSYEYADLHQLPSIWFNYYDNLPEFRQKFIGSCSYKKRDSIALKSKIADSIVLQLQNKKQNEVKNYYADMLESFIEMKRVLKVGGKACIIIGNTEFKKVKILNAEVFCEQLQSIGFKIIDIIKREIPSKMLPSTRDSNTGQFVKATDKNLKLAYPVEYILTMEKL